MKIPLLLFGWILILNLGLSPKGYAAETSFKLGQLFSTPKERAALDQQRYHGRPPTQQNTLTQSDPQTETSFEFNGMISTRSHSLIWVNQRLQQQPAFNWRNWQFNYQAESGHLNLKNQHQAVSLKPGQKYSTHSKKTRESYEP